MFEMIAAMPTLAGECGGFTPAVRIHVHEGHLIVYKIAHGHVAVLRLLGGRPDRISILKAAGL